MFLNDLLGNVGQIIELGQNKHCIYFTQEQHNVFLFVGCFVCVCPSLTCAFHRNVTTQPQGCKYWHSYLCSHRFNE